MQNFGVCLLPEPRAIIANETEALPSYITEAAQFLNEGYAKKALQTLNNASIKIVDSPWGWIVAATAHCRLKNFAVAYEVSQRGLQQAGSNTYLFDCLGVAWSGLNDYANAQNSFLHAIQSDTHNTNAVVNLANIFIAQNNPDAAFATLQQGLKQNPNSREIKSLLVQLHPAWIQPLVGGGLRLRMPVPGDEDFFVRSFTDRAFMNSYHRFTANNQTKQRIGNNLKQNPRYSIAKQKSLNWIIEQTGNANKSGYCPIGLACLAEIQLGHQSAEVLTGFPDPAHRGQGGPLAAMLLLLDFAFNRIGFNKLTSIVYGDNQYSQRSTLALGFTQEGFRPAHLRDPETGHWLNIWENGFLQSDFRKNARLARLSEHLLGFDITGSRMEQTVFEQ